MKVTTVYIAASLAIFLILLHTPTAQSSPSHVAFNQWINRLRIRLSLRPKRGCILYMCAYQHMGATTAKQSKNKSLMRYLKTCANDPKCSPGKRRKRSISSPSRLSRPEADKNTFTMKHIFPRLYSGLSKRNRKENVKSFVSQ